MRILFLSIVPSPYQRDLFAALNAHPEVDIQVRYAEAGSPDSPWPKSELEPYEEVYRSFYISWGGKRFIINRQLPSLEGFDAVVLNGYVTLPAQWLLRTASKKLPLIFWGEKLEHAQGGMRERMQKVLTRPMRKLNSIVAIGKKAARDYQSTFPGIPVYEVPYYCRLDGFQNQARERPGNPVTLLFCGQMIERKGVDLLLEAFRRLTDNGLKCRLLLIGREADLPAMLEKIPEHARELIEFAGFQAPEKLPEYFAQADIFILPSRYDGWGVVVNQALAAGLPVVCSDAVGAAEDLVIPDENGFIFRNGNVDELANQLAEMVESPDMISRFAEKSLELSKGISPDQGAKDWVRILKEVLNK